MSPFARNDILSPTKSYDVGRVSVYDSFLEPIRGDQSRELEIVTNAHVHQVVFEGTRAVGVLVSYGTPDSPAEVLHADDIILCAGTAALQRLALTSQSDRHDRQPLLLFVLWRGQVQSILLPSCSDQALDHPLYSRNWVPISPSKLQSYQLVRVFKIIQVGSHLIICVQVIYDHDQTHGLTGMHDMWTIQEFG